MHQNKLQFYYIVPPLESLWWNNGDLKNKDNFQWQAMIVQPNFITQKIFDWACKDVLNKKRLGLQASIIAKP